MKDELLLKILESLFPDLSWEELLDMVQEAAYSNLTQDEMNEFLLFRARALEA